MRSKKYYLLVSCLLSSVLLFAQADSAQYFLKKGSEEKAGRRFRSAEINFVSGLRFAPDNKELLMLLAETYKEQYKYNDARETYLKVAKGNPSDPEIIRNLMIISFNMHKWNDAIQYAEKLPSDSSAAYVIGR